MSRRTGAVVALAALVVAPLAAPWASADGAEPIRVDWWDERWHFRLPLTLSPQGHDPVTGSPVDLSGAVDPLLLIPLDLTAALAATNARPDGGWPHDGAGRPIGWTLAESSVRVVEVGSEAPLEARFLPFSMQDGGPAFDAQANAAGTLALVLPGGFVGPRDVVVYFDARENGPVPFDRPVPDTGRLDALAAPGPGVHFLAWVPPLPSGARANLVALNAGSGETLLTIERVIGAGSPERLFGPGDGPVPAEGRRFELPGTSRGYDVIVRADRPVVLGLETVTPQRGPGAAVVVPALDGGAAGRHFLVPGLHGASVSPTLDVVGTSGRAEITVTDARTGAVVTTVAVSARASVPLELDNDAVVRLEASEPVIVLTRGAAGGDGSHFLHQAVALEGAPTGTFLVGQRAGGHAAASDAPTTVRAFPLARPADAITGRAGDPPREAWVSTANAAATSEPWAFYAETAEATVLVGSDGVTPITGRSGQRFHVAVAADRSPDVAADGRLLEGRLFAPLPGTTVTVRTSALNGTPLASGAITLSRPGPLGAFPENTRPLVEEDTVLTIDTNRPSFLYLARPGASATYFLPSLPGSPGVEPGELAFFGPLLGWSETLRSVFAKPGERVAVTLELSNRGRAVDGTPLVEDVDLSLEPMPGSSCDVSWTFNLANGHFAAMPSPGTRAVSLIGQVPPTAEPGQCVELVVRASPGTDVNAAVEAHVIVRVRSGFEPELRLVLPDGSLAKGGVITLEPETPREATLRLHNRGAQPGEALVSYAPGPGYQSALTLKREDTTIADATGRSTKTVSVPGNGTVELSLALEVGSAGETPWDFLVQAVSAADPAVRDAVTLSVVPEANLTLFVLPDTRRLTPVPGGHANVSVLLVNLGSDVELAPRPLSALPPGWRLEFEPTRLLLRAAGVNGPTGERLDVGTINATVHAPANATLGMVVPVTLGIGSSLTAIGSVELSLTAIVSNDYMLEIALPTTLLVPPAREVRAPVRFDSAAAGPFSLALSTVVAPAGWNATFPGLPLSLAPGDARTMDLVIQAPDGAAPGAHELQLVLRSSDARSPPLERPLAVQVTTPEAPHLRLSGLEGERIVPAGATLRVPVQLTSAGNLPASSFLAVEPSEGAGAGWDGPDQAVLSVGDVATGHLVVSSPPRPGFGVATVALEGDGGRHVLVLRESARDLVIEHAIMRLGEDGGAFLLLGMANRGTEPVPGLAVDIVHEGRRITNLTLGGLAAGASVEHVVPLVPDLAGSIVEVHGTDAVPDATPSDNSARLELLGSNTREASLPPGIALVLLGVSAACAGRNRRRPR